MATVADRLSDKSVAEPLIVADWESKDFLDPRVDSYIGHRLRGRQGLSDFRHRHVQSWTDAGPIGLVFPGRVS